jgi:sulfite reductase (NADPH) flavoprotein alpha-component
MFASVALVASLVKSKAFPVNDIHQTTLDRKVDISPELVKAVTAELKKEIDAASTAGSQTTIVDEDSSILLQSRVKNAIDYLLTSSSQDSQVRLVDANHAVDYVAYGLSDIVFVYPGSASGYLGQELSTYAQQSARNARNQLVKVVKMETRAGALQAVKGALAASQNKNLTVLASSQTLLSMIPNLHALAQDRQPVVFHVAAQSVDQGLVASANVEAVLAARNTGAILLSSANAQEAHDIAIVAHLLARSVGLPVIHFFNGVTAAKEIEKVNLTSYGQLAKLSSSVATSAVAYTESYQVAKKVLGQLNYKPFEYTGAANAETVLITLSASTAAVEQAVSRAASFLNASVGLLSVRVYRPWSEVDFIAALPKSAKRVVVLEEGAGLYAFNGPVYLDIAASIRFGSIARDQRPRLVSAQATDFSHLHATHVPSLLKEAEHETFINLAAEPFTVSISDETLALEKSDAAWSAIFWDVEQDGTATAAIHDAHLVHAVNPTTKVTARVTRDAYRVGGAVTHTHLTTGATSTAPHQYVAIHNVGVIREYNTLANAAQNATVVLHGPWKHGDEIEGVLSSEFKFGLTEINAKLYTIDAARIAQELGLNIKSTHIVWEVVFLILDQKVAQVADRLAELYNELDIAEDAEIKLTLATLTKDVVESVTMELTPVELLPPWTILELSDVVLPTLPVDRLVGAEEEEDDVTEVASGDDEESAGAESGKWHKAAWQLMFNEAYKTEAAIRPDLHESTYVIQVQENRRLTPDSYDRNVFHIEFDTSKSDLKYLLGDALGVHGHNDYNEVQDFLNWYGLNGNDIVSVNSSEGKQEVRTVFQLFSQTLDIFGRPSKKFYESLAAFASDPKEKEQLLFLISPEGKEDFKKRVEDTVTYEDLLREFTSATPSVEALAQIVAPIKPRHYSIASSQKMYNNAVHLLVVAVDWEDSTGKKRYGQCTRYLSNLKVGDNVTVSIKPSVMKLPPLDSQPVIMAGLGTGMAPFRAFIQERYLAKAAGKKIGPVVLYFGSRNRSTEYLYGEELEAYHADGVLSHMGLAFSRDQKEKVYIQHKMMEDAEMLNEYLMNQKGHFYLCGPTWPVPDVKDAVVHGLTKYSGIDAAQASELIEEWKEKETYILEVY